MPFALAIVPALCAASPSAAPAIDVDTAAVVRVPDGGLTIEDGPLSLRLSDGWVVPLRLDGAFAGLVWVGDGEVTARLDDRADAMVLANDLALDAKVDDAVARRVRERRALETPIDIAIVASIDPDLERIFLPPEEADPLEVTIYNDREARAAARKAATLWTQRRRLYEEVDIDVRTPLLRDLAVAEHHAGRPGRFMFADVRTEAAFGQVHGGGRDDWVASIRDATGSYDPRRRVTLLSMGRSLGGVPKWGIVGGEAFPGIDPDDPTSAPAPPARVEPVRATSRLRVRLGKGGSHLGVSGEHELTVRAVGGPAPDILLKLPRVEAKPRSWDVKVLGLDGARHVAASVVRGDELQVVLDTPLGVGDELTLSLSVEDTWPLILWAPCEYDVSGNGTYASDPRRILPAIGFGVGSDRWNGSIEFDVAADGDIRVVASGETVELPDPGRRRVHIAFSKAAAPEIVLGRWPKVARDSNGPLVLARDAFGGQLDRLDDEVRRFETFLASWAPTMHTEVVTEGSEQCLQHVGRTYRVVTDGKAVADVRITDFLAPTVGCGEHMRLPPRGVAVLRRPLGSLNEWRYAGDLPKTAHATFAHGLAHQTWGHLAQPANPDDYWIVESIAEIYSCMYLARVYGPDTCTARLDQAREIWEADLAGEARLTEAHRLPRWDPVVWRYGPYVLLEMLRPRIGDEAFFAALDVLVIDHPNEPVTTERLQRYFEQASGRDLDDFFDFWIHQGRIPKLALTWEQADDGRVSGIVTSDVPFGTLDVPVRIRRGDDERDVWVDVVDGEGHFTTEPLPPKVKVDLDPDGRVLAKARRVRRR